MMDAFFKSKIGKRSSQHSKLSALPPSETNTHAFLHAKTKHQGIPSSHRSERREIVSVHCIESLFNHRKVGKLHGKYMAHIEQRNGRVWVRTSNSGTRRAKRVRGDRAMEGDLTQQLDLISHTLGGARQRNAPKGDSCSI